MSFLISNIEKIHWQNISSEYVREFQSEASQLIGENPEKIHIIFPNLRIVDRGIYYHAIADDWFTANSSGRSLYYVYGWDMIIRISEYNSIDYIEDFIKVISDDYTILVVYPDKSLKVIN
jgi:hypothetical protein